MWIMLIKKLPTQPSPPRMSIFWSVPWKDGKYSKAQEKMCSTCGEEIHKGTCGCISPLEPTPVTETDQDVWVYELTRFVKDHNWVGARKITYKETDIRVFPNEFSTMTGESMKEYIDNGFELVAEGVASDVMVRGIIERDSEQAELRDVALVEGADMNLAMAAALGADITLPDPDFPAIGWYRCPRQYAEVYCENWEMEE